MSRRSKPLILSVLLLLALDLGISGCDRASSGDAPPARSRLVVTGSSTVAPLVAEIGRRFERHHPGVRIDVQGGGSSRGIADARRSAADIGMASRALAPSESDLQSHTIAIDGVGLIVHADNPITALTDEQVRGIFTGRITSWDQVGGASSEIIVVNKAEGRATLEVFLAHFELRNSAIEADVVIGDNEQGVKTIAGNPHAIGFVSIGAATYNDSIGVPIKLLAAGDVAATLENVSNGSFPITRPLVLVTPDAPAGLVRDFIDFARSDAVHDLIADLQFVPVLR